MVLLKLYQIYRLPSMHTVTNRSQKHNNKTLVVIYQCICNPFFIAATDINIICGSKCLLFCNLTMTSTYNQQHQQVNCTVENSI